MTQVMGPDARHPTLPPLPFPVDAPADCGPTAPAEPPAPPPIPDEDVPLPPPTDGDDPHRRPGSWPRRLPLVRGDCLTAAQRYVLAAREAPPDRPPPIGGWARGVAANGEPVLVPTDGRPDGPNAVRPCGFLSCKYHVALEYNPTVGVISVMWTAPERAGRGQSTEALTDETVDHILQELLVVADKLRAWEASPEGGHPLALPPPALHTCALDLAELARQEGPLTLEQVGEAARKTRERIRQVSDGAYAQLKGSNVLRIFAAREGEDYRGGEAAELPPLVYPDGRAVPVERRSGSMLLVQCDACRARFSARERRLLALGAPLCKRCAPGRPPRRAPSADLDAAADAFLADHDAEDLAGDDL